VNPVPSLHAAVRQFVGGYSRFKGNIAEGTMAFLLGEKTMPVGDQQPEIARARLIDARKIDFVQNAVAQRKPDSAVQVQRGANTGLGARSPARLNSRPPRRDTKLVFQRIIGHRKLPLLAVQQFARRSGFMLELQRDVGVTAKRSI